MGTVVAWAVDRVRERRWAGVRMDTWASNAALIRSYQALGFTRLG